MFFKTDALKYLFINSLLSKLIQKKTKSKENN